MRISMRMSAASTLVTMLALTVTPTVSCAQRERPLPPAESARAMEALVEWFTCEECSEGELQRVTRYSQAVVQNLAGALDGGMASAAREKMRRELDVRYTELEAYARTNPNARPASTREEFVAMYLDNRDAQYRIRAATALAAIGGQRARAALETAAGKPHRPDVQRAIRRSLETMR